MIGISSGVSPSRPTQLRVVSAPVSTGSTSTASTAPSRMFSSAVPARACARSPQPRLPPPIRTAPLRICFMLSFRLEPSSTAPSTGGSGTVAVIWGTKSAMGTERRAPRRAAASTPRPRGPGARRAPCHRRCEREAGAIPVDHAHRPALPHDGPEIPARACRTSAPPAGDWPGLRWRRTCRRGHAGESAGTSERSAAPSTHSRREPRRTLAVGDGADALHVGLRLDDPQVARSARIRDGRRAACPDRPRASAPRGPAASPGAPAPAGARPPR